MSCKHIGTFRCYVLLFLAALLLPWSTFIGESAEAAPVTYDKMERDYYDWPAVLTAGERFEMKPANVYYRGGVVIEREPLVGTWKYVSSDEAVVRVLAGKTLEAVAPGKTSLALKLTIVTTKGTTTTTTTTTFTTTKTIAVASKPFDVAQQLEGRTMEQIKKQYELAKPLHQGTAFTKAPRIRSPFAIGELNPGLVRDGLRMTNFIRYLAGLPNELILDDTLNRQALHGAVINAYWDDLDHTPAQPPGMIDGFYAVASKSTSTGNLSLNSETLHEQVRDFMDDLGANNVAEVGHRRWILNPGLRKTGFGLAKSADNDMYGVMQVFDESGNVQTKVNYDMISWPAKGNFPIDFFNSKAIWSVTLNPALYDSAQTSAIRVTLTRKGDNRKWILDANDSIVREEGQYFGVSTKKIGVPFAILFRPDNVEFEHGDVFQVQISGLRHKTEGVKSLSYEVKWFGLDQVALDTPNFPSTAEVVRPTVKGEIALYMNGQRKLYDQPPLQRGGSVLVPLRGILENLGARLQLNASTQTITATKGTRKVVLTVGQPNATVDGKTVKLTQPAISVEGRVMIPLRFVSEAFAAKVVWEPVYPAVVISFDQ